MPLSLADVLAAQSGAPGPVYEGGPDANVTLGGVLSALLSRGGSLAEQHAPFPVPGMIQLGRTAAGAAALPGDVYSGRTEADLANPEYTNRAADLAQFMIGTPGGTGGLGSGARAALEEAPSFTERMAQGKDIAMERANRGQMTGDYGMGTAKRTAPEAPKGSMEYSSDRLMSSLRDTQAQLQEYKNPQKPLLAPGESPEDFSLFSGGNKKAGAALAAEKTAAGDQFVLPGAERAADATMAQRAADAPLKPTVEQKPADFGLFGDELKQGTLFSGGNTKAGKLLAGIRAYHGSPYDFEKFDISKIGTGEGAQAYGHGLYFAENPKTAESYRPVAPDVRIPDPLANVIDTLQSKISPSGQSSWANTIEQYLENRKRPGKMYEVNINAEPGQFLQWDKPLGEQPQTAEALQQHFAYPFDPAATGQRWIDEAHSYARGNPGSTLESARALTSQRLEQAGIPGIRYLDQGSRVPSLAPPTYDAAGKLVEGDFFRKPTSNYVVFNPEIIDILKKYGLAGLTMGGVLSAAGQEPAPTQ